MLRDSVELFRSQNTAYPPRTNFPAELKTFLRGPFPKCPVGNQNATVRVVADANPLTVSGTEGWAYNSQTGELIVNSSATDPTGIAYSAY